MEFWENDARTCARSASASARRAAGLSTAAAMALASAAGSPGGRSRDAERPENLGDAADIRRQHGNAGGGGLDDHIGERFTARGDDQKAAEGKRFAGRHMAKEADLAAQAETSGLISQRAAFLASRRRSSHRPSGRPCAAGRSRR